MDGVEAVGGTTTYVSLANLAEKWPSTIVAREKVGEFSGGLIDPKTMANLDSWGQGPEGAIRVGRKIAYPVDSLISWIEKRASLRPYAKIK